ncbi:MAG: hypothetical protein V4496_05390 [Pseudomonadota bacterium]
MLQNTQKITVSLPKALLENAQTITGLGIIETIKQGLERLTRAQDEA